MTREAPYTVRKESVAIERTLADVRVILWLATAIVTATLWIESGSTDVWQVLALAVFLAYSVGMWITVRYLPRLFRPTAVVSSFVEVLVITALVLATTRSSHWASYTSTRSPFYLWYVFYVASISLRYGLQLSIISLSASVVLYTAVSMFPPNPRVYSPGFVGDTGFLFILAFLFGHIAERQRSYQTRLAVANELGVALASLTTSRQIVRLLVTKTADLLGADKCWFVPYRNAADVETSSVGLSIELSDSAGFGEWSIASVLERRRALMSNKPRLPSDAAKLLEVKSLAAVPLYVRDVPVGVLYAADKAPRGFSGYDVELLELIAAQAAPIIENVQLWERLKEAAASEERLRIARDLHDNFLQTLSAIKLYLERCRLLVDKDPKKAKASIERMHEISTQGLADVRSYLSQLRLVGPEPSRFGQAAEQCAAEAGSRGGFAVHTEIETSEESLSPEIALAAFQILRELLNNVIKHAQAANVWVRIGHSKGRLEIVVRDDGTGFDVDKGRRASERVHLGMVGIKERVKELDGEFEIASSPGEGTEAQVLLPIEGS